jgi:hypothetical protein
MSEFESQEPSGSVGFKLPPSVIVILLFAALSLAVSWGILQSQINALTSHVEKQDTIGLRADVQAARDEVIMVQLKSVIDRLDHIQKIVDTDKEK